MFYVYALINPIDNLPFYIGKGKGNRAFFHLSNETRAKEENKRKWNKIQSIRKQGYEPVIQFIKTELSEDKAYELETEYIKKYGRKRYDKGGILTNLCIDAKPPNLKGKTYEEIYGKEKAEKIIEKKRQLQLQAGGYGPKEHSEKTKEKFKYLNSGKNNNRYTGHTDEEIINLAIKEFKLNNSLTITNLTNFLHKKYKTPKTFSKKFRFKEYGGGHQGFYKALKENGINIHVNNESLIIKLTNNKNEEYFFTGEKELKIFCKLNNLSLWQFRGQLYNNKSRSVRLPNKGWLAERIEGIRE